MIWTVQCPTWLFGQNNPISLQQWNTQSKRLQTVPVNPNVRFSPERFKKGILSFLLDISVIFRMLCKSVNGIFFQSSPLEYIAHWRQIFREKVTGIFPGVFAWGWISSVHGSTVSNFKWQFLQFNNCTIRPQTCQYVKSFIEGRKLEICIITGINADFFFLT